VHQITYTSKGKQGGPSIDGKTKSGFVLPPFALKAKLSDALESCLVKGTQACGIAPMVNGGPPGRAFALKAF